MLWLLVHPFAADAQSRETLPLAGSERPEYPVTAADWRLSAAGNLAESTAGVRSSGSHRLLGAGIGFVVGASATWIVTHQGGSTSLCDRSSNQDALNATECFGLVVLGGAVGAGVGAIIGAAIHSDQRRSRPFDRLSLHAVPGQHTRIAIRMRL